MKPEFNKIFYSFELKETMQSHGKRFCSMRLYENATGGCISAKISAKQFDKLRKLIKKLEKD